MNKVSYALISESLGAPVIDLQTSLDYGEYKLFIIAHEEAQLTGKNMGSRVRKTWLKPNSILLILSLKMNIKNKEVI